MIVGVSDVGGLDLEGGIAWSLTFFQLWALMSLLFFFCVSLPQYCFNLTQNVSLLLFRPITNQLFNIQMTSVTSHWLCQTYWIETDEVMHLKILQLIFDEINQLGLGVVVCPLYYFVPDLSKPVSFLLPFRNYLLH